MEIARWLNLFRSLGARAERVARPIAGTPAGRRALGKGAAGDTTLLLDRSLENLAVAAARKSGEVRLISEEAGVRDFGRPKVAIIADPLDGSVNAGAGIGLYAVSYALGPPLPTLGNIRLGYIRNLVSGEEYWAFRGKGAFRNGRRIRAQRGPGLGVVLVELSPHPLRAVDSARQVLGAADKVRCLGSMALDLCYVSSGAASALVDLRGALGRPLDLSAGKLILEEAGGTVSDGVGKPLDDMVVNLMERTDTVASANRAVHEKILELVRTGGLPCGK